MAPAHLPAPPRFMSRWIVAVLLITTSTLVAGAALASRAQAAGNQVAIIQDDAQLLTNPVGTLLRFRQLGAQQVRVALRWQLIAPDPNSFKAPAHFDAANPADYPARLWAPYDAIVRDATADRIQVNFNVVGGAPLWATGPGMPKATMAQGWPFHNWEPNANDFFQFMRAVGERYSGSYNPGRRRLMPHNRGDLPRVDFWSIWNEPNYGPSLAPQALPGHQLPGHVPVPASGRMYRALVAAAWAALHMTGHGNDGFLIGELAPRATNVPFGNFNGMLPTTFVQSLYCLGSNYRPLRGELATLEGCPANLAGTRAFVARNAGLFKAGGFSDHAYMRWFPPNQEENYTSNSGQRYPPSVWSSLVHGFSSFGTIGNLTSALNRSFGAYGWKRHLPIWNTEFGYMTDPPKRPNKKDQSPAVSPATAAYYDNWAEYLSWKNPQIGSFEQYLLFDPLRPSFSNNFGGYASGLVFYNGRPKPGYAAWRLPLYMPHTVAGSRFQPLEVWGDVRPAYYQMLDQKHSRVTTQLLFKSASGGGYTLLDTVTIHSRQGYFDVHLKFPSSGTLLMRWYYPTDALFGAASGQAVFSRSIRVTVR